MRQVALRALAIMTLIMGCVGCTQAEKKDAHTSGTIDRTPGEVIAMPDNFANVVNKCDHHGHRVFVTSHAYKKSPAMAITPDPTCK